MSAAGRGDASGVGDGSNGSDGSSGSGGNGGSSGSGGVFADAASTDGTVPTGPDSTTGTTVHGHLVLIGHLYDTNDLADERLLVNSLLLSERPGTIDVLEYVEYVTQGSLSWDVRPVVHPFVTSGVQAAGRSIAFTSLTDYRVLEDQLSSVDVLLVYDQLLASTLQIQFVGYTWNPIIDAFLTAGGVVVVLGGTYPVASGPGLFDLTFTSPSSARDVPLEVASPTDPVAANVPLSYPGSINTTAYPSSTGGTVVVRTRDTQAPVVRHLVR